MSSEHKSFIPYNDLTVNLMTILAVTNIDMDIVSLFNQIQLTPYSPPVRKRGRRKKNDPAPEDIPLDLPEGSVVGMLLRTTEQEDRKGVVDPDRKGFKHSLTVRIVVESRLMCVRIPRTGKLHICGAKSTEEAETLFRYIMKHICSCETPVYTFKEMPCPALNQTDSEGNPLISGMIVVVMRNCNTKLGFSVIRNLLRKKFSRPDSVWIPRVPNPDKDYPGVNIQRSVPYCGDLPISVLTIDPTTTEIVGTTTVTYEDYVQTQTAKNQARERAGRYITFLVFADGSMIVTGLNVDYIRRYYTEFMQLVCVDMYDEIAESVVQSRALKTRKPRPPRPSRPGKKRVPSIPGTSLTVTPQETVDTV